MIGVIKESLMGGYATGSISVKELVICLFFTTLFSLYVFVVYKKVTKRSFYNPSFNLSLIALAIITAAIILTIQSNIVVSLGMVGALSIVRFRTAIKDPMDLVFLFWSIGIGIMCGAGFSLIAFVASIVITIVIVMISCLPAVASPLLLVVNSNSHKDESAILDIVKRNCSFSNVRARNVSKSGMNMAIEIKTEKEGTLIEELMCLECVTNASLVEHDGDVIG